MTTLQPGIYHAVQDRRQNERRDGWDIFDESGKVANVITIFALSKTTRAVAHFGIHPSHEGSVLKEYILDDSNPRKPHPNVSIRWFRLKKEVNLEGI